MEDEFLTKKEVAELLKVTVRTIDRLHSEGLPSVKFGRNVRFEKAEVVAWLKRKAQN